MGTYFTKPPTLLDGDTAFAADVNIVSDRTDAGFTLVDGVLSGQVAAIEAYTDEAEDWATNAEDAEVAPGQYSALHWAAKALAQATTATTQAGIATVQAELATSRAADALINKNATDANVILTNADVVLTHADVVLTHADVVLTNADVVLTNADVVLTHADVISSALSESNALAYRDTASDHATTATTQADIATAAAAASLSMTYISNIADLIAYTGAHTAVFIKGRTTNNDGGQGIFIYTTGDYTAEVTLDTLQAIYIPKSTDLAGSNGVWIRQYSDAVDVKWFGAIGDGSNETTKLQAAFDYIDSIGGGKLLFAGETYRVTGLSLVDNLHLYGVKGVTELKSVAGGDYAVLYNYGQFTGKTIENLTLENIIFDGNQSGSPKVTATSVVTANVSSNFIAKNCTFRNASGYGLALEGEPGYLTWSGGQTDVYLENCYFHGNGVGSGGDTFDGLDIKSCERATIINCFGYSNSDTGINIRGKNVTIIGGSCWSNNKGYVLSDNSHGTGIEAYISIFGAEAYSNTTDGFIVSQSAAASTFPVKVVLSGVRSYSNTGNGFSSGSYKDFLDVTIVGGHFFSNGGHGIYTGTGDAAREFSVVGASCTENTGSGIATYNSNIRVSDCELSRNTRYGFEETNVGSRSQITGSTRLFSNTIGSILPGTNKRQRIGSGVIDYLVGTDDAIASSSTVTFPHTGSNFTITGTTDITAITPSFIGRLLYLTFADVLTVTDATATLALAGDFTTTSGDVLTLICKGSYWAEISRSVN